MVGIKSYGVYLPLWRLDLRSAEQSWRGEKAIANFDEDSLTMGVAAGVNCLRSVDRNTVDGLFFASCTFPYKEKQTAVTVAEALDLRKDILTADYANSLRAGTTALKAAADTIKAGAAKQILVIASDMRPGMPGSDFEREFGDGAVAFLLSNADVRVAIKDTYSIVSEIFDVWRIDEDRYVRSWEERFNMEAGYGDILARAMSGLMEKNKLNCIDFFKAVFNGPNARRHSQMGKKLGFTAEQLDASIFGVAGDLGCASSLMMLASSIGKARAGEKILLGNYGNGADAIILEVVKDVRTFPDVKDYLSSKKLLTDYKRYLHWRGSIEMVTGRRRPPTIPPSATCLWRETEQNIRLRGAKCRKCGMIQYPPLPLCYNCRSKDDFESYRFSDKMGILYTYAIDKATPTPDPPIVLSVVDFDGGGRMWLYMTDKSENEIQIGIPVEMTFRKLFTIEGIHNYYWKCMPVRFSKEVAG